MDLKIDPEEIRQAVIAKCVDEVMENWDGSIRSMVTESLRSRIDDKVTHQMNTKIDDMLGDAMQQTLEESITPVNTWGEKVGEPTTLKAVIHERARDFWNTKVNKEGSPSNYGGKPRWEHLLGEELRGAFGDAIKQDMVNIAGALKDAVRKDFYGAVDKGLNDIFKVKSRAEQAKK
jgi:hypothetical protein